ncbi:hypothetical protein JCM10213_005476, partial [Rhodosporidiobolus nylandii]
YSRELAASEKDRIKPDPTCESAKQSIPCYHTGTPEQLRYAMGLLLQIAHDSGRTFIPPLTATVFEENAGRTRSTEKYVFYVFRVFPISRWAHPKASTLSTVALGRLPREGLVVREPGFVHHALDYLKGSFPDRLEATRLVKELQEPLTLDVREMVSLEEMVHGLTRP